MPHAASSRAGHVPPTDLVTRVRALIDELGLARAARELGLGREATARLAAATRVRPGTVALAEQSLARREARYR